MHVVFLWTCIIAYVLFLSVCLFVCFSFQIISFTCIWRWNVDFTMWTTGRCEALVLMMRTTGRCKFKFYHYFHIMFVVTPSFTHTCFPRMAPTVFFPPSIVTPSRENFLCPSLHARRTSWAQVILPTQISNWYKGNPEFTFFQLSSRLHKKHFEFANCQESMV